MTVFAFPTLPKTMTCKIFLPFILGETKTLAAHILTHPGYQQGTLSFPLKDHRDVHKILLLGFHKEWMSKGGTFGKITVGKKMCLGFSVLSFTIIIGKRWKYYVYMEEKSE